MEKIGKKLGQRISNLRGRMSQERLSTRSGVPRRTLQNIENGVTDSPGIDNLARIADALGTSIDYLLGRNANPIIPTQQDIKALIETPGPKLPWGPIGLLVQQFADSAPNIRAVVLAVLYNDRSLLNPEQLRFAREYLKTHL